MYSVAQSNPVASYSMYTTSYNLSYTSSYNLSYTSSGNLSYAYIIHSVLYLYDNKYLSLVFILH